MAEFQGRPARDDDSRGPSASPDRLREAVGEERAGPAASSGAERRTEGLPPKHPEESARRGSPVSVLHAGTSPAPKTDEQRASVGSVPAAEARSRSTVHHALRFLAIVGFVAVVYFGTRPSGTDRGDTPVPPPASREAARIGAILPPAGETSAATAKIFFNNGALDPALTCDKVFPVERDMGVDSQDTPEQAALALLLLGPSDAEADDGYFTSISPGIGAVNVNVTDGTVTADLSARLADGVTAGSCRAAAIRAQVTETLRHASGAERVRILLDGNPENIFN